MATLELRFLGDLEVIRDGEVAELPPSKKTRALLAYLALHQRRFRREHLCELLWEVPDDPRGSLRWSLSKLRRVVDADDRLCIVADRTHVAFDAADVVIDVVALRALAEHRLEHAPVAELEDAADRYRGNLLEGLDLSGLHDFHAWCIAEREIAARAQANVLRTLVGRLEDSPERALRHARALVGISPYDEEARATLIRHLVTSGRAEEAEQQVRLGTRILKEAGVETSSVLHRAWRGAPRAASATHAKRQALDAPAPKRTDSLVGRDAELARLAAALSEVANERRAAVVFVCGEPGIGKSRLLEAAAALARKAGAFILEANVFESESIRPFALWIDALQKLAPGTASDVFSGRDDRDRLFGGLSELVGRESADRPVVLLFDDLQWCDESSAAALHYAVRMNRHRPLLGILAARDGEMRDNRPMQQALRGLRRDAEYQELKLGRLREGDLRRLIAERIPHADSDQLSRECGGNPLLAIELAYAQTSGESGGSLGELVRERLARSDVDAGEVLRWAAVMAPRIDVESLVRVTGLDANRVGEMLESAERQVLLLPTERGFRFFHDLVARSVYAEISPARRRVMHRRVAGLLEHDTALDLEVAADLAHHASLSGDPGLAARAMVSAGRLCLRFFANDDALALARKGLQLAEQLSDAERVCVTLELRDVLLTAAPLEDWEPAAAESVALAERALDHGALSHARLGYQMASELRWAHGHWAGAREGILQAERVTRAGSAEDHVIGLAEAAKCLVMLERDLTRAQAMLMEAQSIAARRQLSHHAIPACLGMLLFHEGKLDEAEERFLEARTLCKSGGHRITEFQANEYLVMIDFERGRFDAAMARCSTLLEIGEKLREGSEAPFARALEALCRYALGEPPDRLGAALDELRIADAKHRLAYTLTRAALLDVERGRLDQGLARASEALGHAEVLERVTEMMLAHVALAMTHRSSANAAAYQRHVAAVAALEGATVAQWARHRAASLLGENKP